jgi:hypothetical protein
VAWEVNHNSKVKVPQVINGSKNWMIWKVVFKFGVNRLLYLSAEPAIQEADPITTPATER